MRGGCIRRLTGRRILHIYRQWLFSSLVLLIKFAKERILKKYKLEHIPGLTTHIYTNRRVDSSFEGWPIQFMASVIQRALYINNT